MMWKIIPGLTHYSQGLAIMKNHVEQVKQSPSNEVVLFMEHEDIYTAGTSSKEEELINEEEIEVAYTGRGGKFTYHGPGQRVIYPILNLSSEGREEDIRKYIRDLEEVVISTLFDFGIVAFLKEGLIGIWVNHNGEDKKIAAVGVRIQKWVTFHGVAININTDLDKFKGIIPCGITEFGVTSMKEIGKPILMEDFDEAFMMNFERIFIKDPCFENTIRVFS